MNVHNVNRDEKSVNEIKHNVSQAEISIYDQAKT